MSAPRSPTSIPGNPRNRALEIGTDAGGFPADIPYDHQAGMPSGAPGHGGKYSDNVGAPPAISPSDSPDPKPFK